MRESANPKGKSMNSALTINQLLGVSPDAPPALLFNAAANDSFQLSDAELATILGGSMSAFETAATFLAAGALIVSGAGVLATAGYATAAVLGTSFGVGFGIGGAGAAFFGGS
jgi:hypothetical protein